MPRPSTGLVLAGGLATAMTVAIAWPVLFNPSQLIFGREIVGRHADAYGVIQQIGGAGISGSLSQPLTDLPGWLLGRVLNPVAAFNVLILLTFPLSAMSAYALARYLTSSHAAALIAAIVFAFSPFHLAHAAYHPHIAQTQWIPLYLLALIALVDRLSISRTVAVAAACAGLVLSNYDAGLIGAILSPMIVLAFWVVRPDADRNWRPVVWPTLVLVLLAGLGAGLIAWLRPTIWTDASSLTFRANDVAFYRARWWAYLIPPVDHPWLGDASRSFFRRRGVSLQLVEEQLFLGFSFLALAAAALGVALWTWRSDARRHALVALGGLGVAAFLVSLGPVSGSCDPASMAPACLFSRVLPLFRAYARFGVVVELSVAILAGAGAVLLARHSRAGRNVAAALLILGAFEFWPLPARAHDVLPTGAHRRLAAEPAAGATLDCFPGSDNQVLVPWLMKRSLTFLDDAIPTCQDPELGRKLMALGYEHVLVRASGAASKLPVPVPEGLTVAEEFPDAVLYSVASTPPPVATIGTAGFYAYEHNGDDWWRWMGPSGRWSVRNTTPGDQRVTLSVDLIPVGMPRTVTVVLDGAPAGRVMLDMTRRVVLFGPWTLTPGDHVLAFAADGEPFRPSDLDNPRDHRTLTVAFRADRWIKEP